MTYRYNRTAATELTPQVVDLWKKEIRAITKIYKGIGYNDDWRDPSPEKNRHNEALYHEARDIFRNFRQTFESWLDGVVVHKPQMKDRGYFERELAIKGHQALSELSMMFPTMYDYRTQEHGLPALQDLVQNRDKRIKRMQLLFNNFFKELQEYLDAYQGKIVRQLDPIEVYNIRGVKVIINNRGREASGTDEGLERFLKELGHSISLIERAGFGAAVHGLTVNVSFDNRDFETAGKYAPDKDEMTIYFLGFGEGTFTHETGHRYWFRNLGNNARHHWIETLNGRTLVVTRDDVDEFVNDFIGHELKTKKYVDPEALARQIEHVVTNDDDLKVKLLEMSNHLPSRNTLDEYLEWFMKEWVGKKVSLEKITDYGSTDPVEAYADAFRLYVINGPNSLKPWSREFFRTISRDGGAKLARKIVARFKDTRLMR